MKRLVMGLFVFWGVSLYGWYGNVRLALTPTYSAMNDSMNAVYGYGVYNIDGGGTFFFSSLHFVDVSLRNTLISGTNVTNILEIRRLLWQIGNEYSEDRLSWSFTAGRNLYRLDGGRLLQRLGDGAGARLSYRTYNLDTTISYQGLTARLPTNAVDPVLTNHRLNVGGLGTMPLWVFSFVRAGVGASVDLRDSNRTTLVMLTAGLQGNIGRWVSYVIHGWHGMGEITLTRGAQAMSVSTWAHEGSLLVGAESFPLQGKVRWLSASGEGAATGWNRFQSLGSLEGPAVLSHPIANLSMLQSTLTWRPIKDLVAVSIVHGILWRPEARDITLLPLYGTGNYLGQEAALQVVAKIDPNVTLFMSGGMFWKGEAFAINRAQSLYRITMGMTIEL